MDDTPNGLYIDPDRKFKDFPDDIRKLVTQHMAKKTAKPKKPRPKVPFVGKNHPKYRVTLKLINKVLVNMGKPEIDNLLDFKNIEKNDIVTDKNKKALEEMENEIFAKDMFTKIKLQYYRKVDNIVLNTIRRMVANIGMQLSHKQMEIIKRNGYRRSGNYYTILK